MKNVLFAFVAIFSTTITALGFDQDLHDLGFRSGPVALYATMEEQVAEDVHGGHYYSVDKVMFNVNYPGAFLVEITIFNVQNTAQVEVYNRADKNSVGFGEAGFKIPSGETYEWDGPHELAGYTVWEIGGPMESIDDENPMRAFTYTHRYWIEDEALLKTIVFVEMMTPYSNVKIMPQNIFDILQSHIRENM